MGIKCFQNFDINITISMLSHKSYPDKTESMN
jgi:hypothetical protein